MIDLTGLKKHLTSEKERIERCLRRDIKEHKKALKSKHYHGILKKISIPEWEKQLKWINETLTALKELKEARSGEKIYKKHLNVHDDDGNPCNHLESCNCHWTDWTDPRQWKQQLEDIEAHIEMLIEPETLEKIGADKIEHRDLPFRIMRILSDYNGTSGRANK